MYIVMKSVEQCPRGTRGPILAPQVASFALDKLLNILEPYVPYLSLKEVNNGKQCLLRNILRLNKFINTYVFLSVLNNKCYIFVALGSHTEK